MDQAIAVAKWLSGTNDVLEAKPVIVAIGQQSWQGAWYRQMFKACPGATNPNDYVHEAIFLVGEVPKRGGRHKGPKTCFVVEGDHREWYLSGHYQNPDPKFDHFHPFGINFALAPWEVPGGDKIDQHEPKPYARLPMTVTYL